MNRFCDIVGGLVALFIASSSVQAAIRYVKPTSSGTGDCTSWANACNLPDGLSAAQSGDEIWCRSGTYDGFDLKNAVKIIGGFAGTETNASQSDPTTNQSIIDGGVVGSDNEASTVLRGFTIRNGLSGVDGEGGGIALKNSSAMIVQCIIEDNATGDFGGAVGVNGGSPQFISCIFRNNGQGAANPLQTKGGGAVFIREGTPLFVNCLFDNNKAWEGGVLLVMSGRPTFINCTIVNNEATIGTGGAFNDPDGKASFQNCVFRTNKTAQGEARYSLGFSGSGGTTEIRYSNAQGGWTGTGNIDANPLFQSFVGGNYELKSTSPCKNTGDSSALPADSGDLDWDGNTTEPIPLDLARFTRVGLGSVDMGAYEFGCHTGSPDCDFDEIPDTCEIEADPTLDCTNQNGILDLCETNPSIPRGACCVGPTCNWPTTSCQCTAGGGEWHQGKKCFQVTCGIPTE